MRRKINSFWNLTIVSPRNFWYVKQLNIWSDDPDEKIEHSSFQNFRSGKKCRNKAISLAKEKYVVIVHHYTIHHGKRQCTTWKYESTAK